MKRIKAINGYTIYEATKKDVEKYNVLEGYFYIYFSSDIRDYGLNNSYFDWEAGSIEEAVNWCSGNNYAIAREIVEAGTTCATFEEIERVEAQLNAGTTADEIEAAREALDDCEAVSAIKDGHLYFVYIESAFYFDKRGPYFTFEAADAAAKNYALNTGAQYLQYRKY